MDDEKELKIKMRGEGWVDCEAVGRVRRMTLMGIPDLRLRQEESDWRDPGLSTRLASISCPLVKPRLYIWLLLFQVPTVLFIGCLLHGLRVLLTLAHHDLFLPFPQP